jgi:hypothetical protein
MQRIIAVSIAILALSLGGYAAGKVAPCWVWKEIGVRPAWAVTCCCTTPSGGMCCNEQQMCAGRMVMGCVCQP